MTGMLVFKSIRFVLQLDLCVNMDLFVVVSICRLVFSELFG